MEIVFELEAKPEQLLIPDEQTLKSMKEAAQQSGLKIEWE